ncbi:hypothetical protein [Amycolatopsis sp. cmx-4-68]|uniref:hypothetical protein n=1 Tax=Amycolatopsis sp. cmx-4-68 TaxID=2790938 RepID=UPI00397DDBAE
MVTSDEDEIERRVEEVDTARRARRVAAAKRLGKLAQEHADLAENLAGVERDLGELLAEASPDITIDELATFTGVSVADLEHWQSTRKPTRHRRKRATAASERAGTPQPPTAQTSAPGRGPTPVKAGPTPAGRGESTTVMR